MKSFAKTGIMELFLFLRILNSSRQENKKGAKNMCKEHQISDGLENVYGGIEKVKESPYQTGASNTQKPIPGGNEDIFEGNTEPARPGGGKIY
jgi:hypothetical protein